MSEWDNEILCGSDSGASTQSSDRLPETWSMDSTASIPTTASTLSLSGTSLDDTEEATAPWISAGHVTGALLLTLLLLCYCCMELIQDEASEERENSVSSRVDGDDMDVQLETQVAGNEVAGGGSFHSQSTKRYN